MAPGCAPAADTSGVGGGCEAESGTPPGRVLQPACCICLDSPAADGAATTACGHSFCVGCILEWVERKPTCPCCKAGPIESLSLHRQLDGTSVAEARTEPVVLLLRAKWRVRPQLAGPEEPELEPEPEPEPEQQRGRAWRAADSVQADHADDWLEDDFMLHKAARLVRGAGRHAAEAWGVGGGVQQRRRGRRAQQPTAKPKPSGGRGAAAAAERPASTARPSLAPRETSAARGGCARKLKKERQKEKARQKAQAKASASAAQAKALLLDSPRADGTLV